MATKKKYEQIGEVVPEDVCKKTVATLWVSNQLLITEVIKMRNLQKAYYANKTTANLQAALAQEKYIDELLNQA